MIGVSLLYQEIYIPKILWQGLFKVYKNIRIELNKTQFSFDFHWKWFSTARKRAIAIYGLIEVSGN